MAEAEAVEQVVSREMTVNGQGVGFTTNWFVFNTDDLSEALTLLPKVGDQFEQDGSLFDSVVSEITISETENQNPITLTAEITYIPTPRPSGGGGGGGQAGNANTATWSLSIGTETINVRQAISQQSFPEAPKPYLTINETKEGVEGVDIISSTASLKIVHWLDEEDAGPRFFNEIQREVASTVNKDAFRGPWGLWKAGEVLYLGVEVAAKDDLIQLTHKFKRSVQGKVDVVYQENGQPQTKPVLKKGWEYLWSWMKPVFKDPNDRTKGSELGPFSTHIAEVYKEGDFKALQLPDEFFPENLQK